MNQRFCSQRCHFEAHRRKVVCPTCGKVRFIQKAKPQKDYCSLKCWGKAHHADIEIFACKVCGKTRKKVAGKANKYCSKPCSDKGRTIPRDIYWARWKERVKNYRKANPHRTAAWKQNRRARELNAEGSFTPEEWKQLQEKYNNACAFCKTKTKLSVDHIIPLCKGGSNYISNIQPLCMPCNSKKHIKIML